jgi:hypothetical protein
MHPETAPGKKSAPPPKHVSPKTRKSLERTRKMASRPTILHRGAPLPQKGTAAVAEDAGSWIWSESKGAAKSIRQMNQRGWTPQQVTEAIKGGEQFPARNLVNPNNPAIRYVHPVTGQSVVQDTVTNEILHFGGPGFLY